MQTLVFPTPVVSHYPPGFDFERLPSSPRPLVAAPPSPGCELCVVIPVHNEEDAIVGTLTALAAQIDRAGEPLDLECYEILVLANNCHDRTAALTRQFAAANPRLRLHLIDTVLPPPHAHVGAARRLVMDEAYRRLTRLGRPRGVIASTDGDTQVRPGWVAGILREIARGADAVGGRIQSSRKEIAGLDPGARRYYHRDLAYRTLRAAYESILLPEEHNAWPRHHHCFGASLAVTAETYHAAGGIPVVHCLEDMAFGRSLQRVGARVRHSPEVAVQTSMRCDGRVGVGLSGTLTIWARAALAGEPWLVESPEAIEREVADRRCVREFWRKGFSEAAANRAAACLEVDAGWLRGAWRRAATSGELYLAVEDRQRHEGTGWAALPRAEVLAASAELRRRLKEHRPALRGAARSQVRRAGVGRMDDARASDSAAARPYATFC